MAVNKNRAKSAKGAKSAKLAKAPQDNTQMAAEARDIAAKLKSFKDFRSAERPENAATRYPHPSDSYPVPETVHGIPVVGETGDGQRWILEGGGQEAK